MLDTTHLHLWPAMEKSTTSRFGYGSTQTLLQSSMVKEPGSKNAPKPSYGQKLYTGHPCLSLQIFEKRRVLYVHSSTFNVSVYAPYYATRFVCHNEFARKDVHRQSASTVVLVLKTRYREKRWTLSFVSCLWSFVQLRRHAINTPGCGCLTTWSTSGQVQGR